VAPVAYAWDIVSNGGVNVALSAFDTATTTFTAPAVKSATQFQFRCSVTDATGRSPAQGTVQVTVDPTLTSLALVADAGAGASVVPGQVVTLDGSKTGWFNSAGSAVQGPSITYLWQQIDKSGLTAFVANPNAATTTFVAPALTQPTQATQLYTPATLSFRLTASNASVSSSTATVNFYVDPYGPLNLTISPAASSGKLNGGAYDTVIVKATATTISATQPQLYYRWTLLQRAHRLNVSDIAIGGDTVNTFGFTPKAGFPGTYTFQVEVGYQPMSDKTVNAVPGTYRATAVFEAL
jgi:hypothetical protein